VPFFENRTQPGKERADIGLDTFRHLLKAQIGATMLVALVGLLVSLEFSLSLFLGGISVAIATRAQTHIVFRAYSAQRMAQLLHRFIAAEIVKLVTICMLFALIFLTIEWIDILALLLGVFLMNLVPTVAANPRLLRIFQPERAE
jgi:F0F1-type ATP synthase assembly protein I